MFLYGRRLRIFLIRLKYRQRLKCFRFSCQFIKGTQIFQMFFNRSFSSIFIFPPVTVIWFRYFPTVY